MIAYIEGEVLSCGINHTVIKVGGIGYKILMCKHDLDNLVINQKTELFIHTNVREDALELYGFRTNSQRDLFLLLISVSGVGPKLGLNIASYFPQHELINAILGKDLTKLSSIPGIGKKTAERIVLELKDKVLKLEINTDNLVSNNSSNLVTLQQAIKNLGYSKEQYNKAITKLDQDELSSLPLEILIKKTLGLLSGASNS